MAPGGQLVIGADHNWSLSRVDVAKETSWTEGRLIFMRDPLSEAVAEMDRYSPRKLVFKDGKIPEKQVVGVFQAGDVDGFEKAMELNGIARRVSSSEEPTSEIQSLIRLSNADFCLQNKHNQRQQT